MQLQFAIAVPVYSFVCYAYCFSMARCARDICVLQYSKETAVLILFFYIRYVRTAMQATQRINVYCLFNYYV